MLTRCREFRASVSDRATFWVCGLVINVMAVALVAWLLLGGEKTLAYKADDLPLTVKPGMTQDEVVRLMGSPEEKVTDNSLGDIKTIFVYASGRRKFLVFFDARGRVIGSHLGSPRPGPPR